MEVQREYPNEEIERLEGCINDLVSVLALPAVWTAGEPAQIVHTLLEALVGMLDLVYMRLKGLAGEAPIEMVRVAPSQTLTARPQEIGEALCNSLRDDPPSRLNANAILDC